MDTPRSPEELQSLQKQARRLRDSQQPVKIVTNTAHSIIPGRIVDFDEGTVTFQNEVERNVIPWSTVAYIQEPLPALSSMGQASGQAGGYDRR